MQRLIYVLADIECNYTLKHVFDDNISYFTNYTANLSQLYILLFLDTGFIFLYNKSLSKQALC